MFFNWDIKVFEVKKIQEYMIREKKSRFLWSNFLLKDLAHGRHYCPVQVIQIQKNYVSHTQWLFKMILLLNMVRREIWLKIVEQLGIIFMIMNRIRLTDQ